MHVRQMNALYMGNAKRNMLLYAIHYKRVNKSEKDVSLEDIHSLLQFALSQEGSNE